MYAICRQIKTDGHQCGSPALKDTLFCWHHTRIKKLTRRRRNPNDFTHLVPFVFPEDRAAIQTNHFLVMQALNEGRIDQRTANSYTSMLRACRINLGKTPLLDADHDTVVRRVILTPEGDEIAPPREQLEEGEAEPLHHKDCPCQCCAEQFRNAAPEQHHQNCKCGLCQEDLSIGQPQLPTDVILSEATAPGSPASGLCSMGWEGSAVEGPAVLQSSHENGCPILDAPFAARVGDHESGSAA